MGRIVAQPPGRSGKWGVCGGGESGCVAEMSRKKERLVRGDGEERERLALVYMRIYSRGAGRVQGNVLGQPFRLHRIEEEGEPIQSRIVPPVGCRLIGGVIGVATRFTSSRAVAKHRPRQ